MVNQSELIPLISYRRCAETRFVYTILYKHAPCDAGQLVSQSCRQHIMVVSAFFARDCRFGRAGYGGCPGRAAGDARQRRRCGAQSYTALRRWRYLLSRAA